MFRQIEVIFYGELLDLIAFYIIGRYITLNIWLMDTPGNQRDRIRDFDQKKIRKDEILGNLDTRVSIQIRIWSTAKL